jgi:hypothetical protein
MGFNLTRLLTSNNLCVFDPSLALPAGGEGTDLRHQKCIASTLRKAIPPL